MENQDQNYDNRYSADDDRVYYDESGGCREDSACLRLGFPYHIFYFRC